MPATNESGSVRPALWAALPLVLGIALFRYLPQFPSIWIVLSFAAIGVGFILNQRGRGMASSICIALAIAAAGVAVAQLRAFAYPGDHIGQYTSDEPRLACVKLRITEPPLTIESSRSWMLPPRQTCTCQAVAVRTLAGWRPASGTVQMSLVEAAPKLAAGQSVLAVGMLGRPAGPMNPGQFDEAEELRERGVLAELEVRHASAVQVLSEGRPPVLPALQSGAEELLQSGFSGDKAVDGALLEALILGHRPGSLHDVEDDFSAAGVMHLLASNGARIAVFAACIYLLGRLLGLHPRIVVYLTAAGAAMYGCLTAGSPQAIRPVLLCAAAGIAFAGRRSVDSVQLLACAAIALLIAQPMDLFAAGFQLSFVTVLGLMLLSAPARRAWLAMEDPDERVLASFGRLSPIRMGWQAVRRRMLSLLAMALIAWAAALPLVAYHFQQVNPYSVPMGLLLSPVVFACLVAGMAKIALTAAVPGLASVWSSVAGAPVEVLRHAVHAAAKLPGSDLPTPMPGWAWMIVWYGGLLALALSNRAGTAGRAGQRKWLSTAIRLGSPATGALLLAAPLAGMGRPSTDAAPMRITVLAVGAGQCAVIEAPDGKATLIDAGSASTARMMREVLGPFLRFQGRRHVARLVLSSSASDCMSAAGDVVADCGDPAVFTSARVARSIGENWQYAELLDHLDRSHRSATPIRAGEKIDLGQGATLSALWPTAQGAMTGPNAGLVLKLEYAGRTMLFPGDIGEPAEQALLQRPGSLSADLLVAPHRGSCDGETEDLIRAVDPAIVISSDSHELTAKQERLASADGNRPLLRTGACGAITITIGADGSISVVPFLRLGDHGGGKSLGIAAGQRRVDPESGGADH